MLLAASLIHLHAQTNFPPANTNAVVHHMVFDGVKSETKWNVQDLNANMPTDWTPYNYLVMEMRTATPQRFSLWLQTAHGPRRIMLQPFGQNVWLRACIPLSYFKGQQAGADLAAANNRRMGSFWMSVWGPFGDLSEVQSLSFIMEYPINKPTVELRGVHVSKDDEGSIFLEKLPVLDEFGQWAAADWPRKIHSRAQLDQELADEAKALKPGDFGYGEYGGYTNTQTKATGFFRVEQIDGKWWFVDPQGHLFLSTSLNGLGSRGGGRGAAAPPSPTATPGLQERRLEAWGFNTGGAGMKKPYIVMVTPSRGANTFLGMPDVYSDAFASDAAQTATRLCAPRKDDPMVLGYFVGNEPPWANRESEVADMILKGPPTATQARLKEFLAAGDTPARRTDFVVAAFNKQLEIACGAIRKADPNHLLLGIRFGGEVPDAMLQAGHIFDVCSINVYEYEPTKQVARAYRVSGRPVLIGEFHFGVPAEGLGAGLVQTQDQNERANGYRYYVEQAAALPGFLGAHWFTWRDEPVLGRMDGENYNIGFVDVTDRPYLEMVAGAKATHARLFEVHSGKIPPFSQRPKASSAGTPDSPWTK
jgi:hypothetical protein